MKKRAAPIVTSPSRTWTVPVAHPAFAGHFPGNPILPGVVLLDEAIRMAGELLPTHTAGWQVGNAKFLAPVGPGAELTFSFAARAAAGFTFTVREGGRDVASGSLTPLAP
jgi:3-hydroxymyristoyl/3-hydroxydecanoyl-(acyl carrier protein) dehydratase